MQLAPAVRQLIRAEQERGYRNLAIKLGLGANPEKAYERLSGVRVSETLHSPYEHPNRYLIMERLFAGIQKGMAAAKMVPLRPTPAFATLPSGNISARLIIEHKTHVPVIFFEQGLFEFFRDFCHLIGWAVPPLSPRHLSDDEALTKLAHGYTMPFQASDFFIRSLGSYAFEGSPMLTGQRVPAPQHNMPVCMALLTLMERFVMCHEIGHITSVRFVEPSFLVSV